MIERNGGIVEFHCDTCSESEDSGEEDFTLAWAAAKREGWRAFKVEAEWCHACPACAEDHAEHRKQG